MATNYGKTLWQNPNTKRWEKEKGWVILKNWQGTKDAIDDLGEQLSFTDNVETIEIISGVTNRLTYTQSTLDNSNQQKDDNNALQDASWECNPERIDRDIKTSEDFRQLAITGGMVEIDAAMENGLMDDNGEFDIKGYCTEKGKTIEQYFDEKYIGMNAGKYYLLRASGVDSFPMFRWTIRKTITTNKKTFITAKGDGLGEKPQVIPMAQIGIPSDVRIDAPSGYLWLVIPPSVSKQGKKKTITYSWEGAERFSPTLYDGGNKEPWEP